MAHNYRLLIERTGHEYLRITLQHKPRRRWIKKQRKYLLETSATFKSQYNIIRDYLVTAYKLTPADIIDTRVSYKGMSLPAAYINELKLVLEGYVWRKRLLRIKKQAISLHNESGTTQATRRKYWVMTDYYGNPMLMNSRLKNLYKAKKFYSKEVDALALDAECLFNTDTLYA